MIPAADCLWVPTGITFEGSFVSFLPGESHFHWTMLSVLGSWLYPFIFWCHRDVVICFIFSNMPVTSLTYEDVRSQRCGCSPHNLTVVGGSRVLTLRELWVRALVGESGIQRARAWPKKDFCSFLGGWDGEESAFNAGDPGSIPGSGRSPGEENGNPLHHSCLKNSMDEFWRAAVHRATKHRTGLMDQHFQSRCWAGSRVTKQLPDWSDGWHIASWNSPYKICIFKLDDLTLLIYIYIYVCIFFLASLIALLVNNRL